jgi:hypothetical protein
MGLTDLFKGFYYKRNINGDHFYRINTEKYGNSSRDLLKISQNHPLLTPALLFISQLFAQARFKVVNSETKEIIKGHWLSELLKNPNFYQSGIDLLENFMFLKTVVGSVAIYKKKPVGMDATEFYVLNTDLIEYPKDFNTKMTFRDKIGSTYVIYDKEGENIRIKLEDLMFFYDLPNGINKIDKKNNHFKSKSRIKGLMQTLINTDDSLLAKNIILKSNGKEMISSGNAAETFPMSPNEKVEAEKLFNSNYGLSRNKSRTWITKASVDWKSLHIALRDLGLDESVKTDANIIYTALHIPKDILSLDNKKTTYANQKESMVSYIQNDMQGALNDFTNTLTLDLLEGEELIGSYDHMPVMQFILLQKYDIENKRATALQGYLNAGVSKQDALDLLDLTDIKLEGNGQKEA